MEKKAPIQVGDYSFTILIEPNDPDGYLVTCPALPGLVTQGDTLDEAYAMAKVAIEGYLISLIKHGEPVPENKWAMPISVRIENDQIAADLMPKKAIRALQRAEFKFDHVTGSHYIVKGQVANFSSIPSDCQNRNAEGHFESMRIDP